MQPLIAAAAKGELSQWERSIPGTLALIILLDQYPRVLWPNSPKRFTHDLLARDIVMRALENGVSGLHGPCTSVRHACRAQQVELMNKEEFVFACSVLTHQA